MASKAANILRVIYFPIREVKNVSFGQNENQTTFGEIFSAIGWMIAGAITVFVPIGSAIWQMVR
jgi:hypothetical protein